MAPPSLAALQGKRTPEVITAEIFSGAASAPRTIPPRAYANMTRDASASSLAPRHEPLTAGQKRLHNEQALWHAQRKNEPTCASGPQGFRTEVELGGKREEQPASAQRKNEHTCESGPQGFRTEVELGNKREEQPAMSCVSGPSGYRTEAELTHGGRRPDEVLAGMEGDAPDWVKWSWSTGQQVQSLQTSLQTGGTPACVSGLKGFRTEAGGRDPIPRATETVSAPSTAGLDGKTLGHQPRAVQEADIQGSGGVPCFWQPKIRVTYGFWMGKIERRTTQQMTQFPEMEWARLIQRVEEGSATDLPDTDYVIQLTQVEAGPMSFHHHTEDERRRALEDSHITRAQAEGLNECQRGRCGLRIQHCWPPECWPDLQLLPGEWKPPSRGGNPAATSSGEPATHLDSAGWMLNAHLPLGDVAPAEEALLGPPRNLLQLALLPTAASAQDPNVLWTPRRPSAGNQLPPVIPLPNGPWTAVEQELHGGRTRNQAMGILYLGRWMPTEEPPQMPSASGVSRAQIIQRLETAPTKEPAGTWYIIRQERHPPVLTSEPGKPKALPADTSAGGSMQTQLKEEAPQTGAMAVPGPKTAIPTGPPLKALPVRAVAVPGPKTAIPAGPPLKALPVRQPPNNTEGVLASRQTTGPPPEGGQQAGGRGNRTSTRGRSRRHRRDDSSRGRSRSGGRRGAPYVPKRRMSPDQLYATTGYLPAPLQLIFRGAGSRGRNTVMRDIHPTDTVATVIRHLHEDRLCGGLDHTYLVCRGKRLEVDARVCDLNIRQHDHLEIRHRLRGGATGNLQGDSSAGTPAFPALPAPQMPVGQTSATSILQNQGNRGNAHCYPGQGWIGGHPFQPHYGQWPQALGGHPFQPHYGQWPQAPDGQIHPAPALMGPYGFPVPQLHPHSMWMPPMMQPHVNQAQDTQTERTALAAQGNTATQGTSEQGAGLTAPRAAAGSASAGNANTAAAAATLEKWSQGHNSEASRKEAVLTVSPATPEPQPPRPRLRRSPIPDILRPKMPRASGSEPPVEAKTCQIPGSSSDVPPTTEAAHRRDRSIDPPARQSDKPKKQKKKSKASRGEVADAEHAPEETEPMTEGGQIVPDPPGEETKREEVGRNAEEDAAQDPHPRKKAAKKKKKSKGKGETPEEPTPGQEAQIEDEERPDGGQRNPPAEAEQSSQNQRRQDPQPTAPAQPASSPMEQREVAANQPDKKKKRKVKPADHPAKETRMVGRQISDGGYCTVVPPNWPQPEEAQPAAVTPPKTQHKSQWVDKARKQFKKLRERPYEETPVPDWKPEQTAKMAPHYFANYNEEGHLSVAEPTAALPDRIWQATKDDPRDDSTFNVASRTLRGMPKKPAKWNPNLKATKEPERSEEEPQCDRRQEVAPSSEEEEEEDEPEREPLSPGKKAVKKIADRRWKQFQRGRYKDCRKQEQSQRFFEADAPPPSLVAALSTAAARAGPRVSGAMLGFKRLAIELKDEGPVGAMLIWIGKTLKHVAFRAAKEEERAYKSVLKFLKEKKMKLRRDSDQEFCRRIEHWRCMANDAPALRKDLIYHDEHKLAMEEWLDPRPETEKNLIAYLRKTNLPRHIRWLERKGITPAVFLEEKKAELPHHKAWRLRRIRKAQGGFVQRLSRQNPTRRQVEKRDNPWPAKASQQSRRGTQRKDKWWLKTPRWQTSGWGRQSWRTDGHRQATQGNQRVDTSSRQYWPAWQAERKSEWHDKTQKDWWQQGWQGTASHTWRGSSDQGWQGRTAVRKDRDRSPDRKARAAPSPRRSPRQAHRAGRRTTSRSRSGTRRRDSSTRAPSRDRRPKQGRKEGGRARSTTSERIARGRSRSARREHKKDRCYNRSRRYMARASRDGTLHRGGDSPTLVDSSPPPPSLIPSGKGRD